MASPLFFSIWFVLENCFVHFFIFDFLLRVTRTNGRRYLPFLLLGNGFITWVVVSFQIRGTFLLDAFALFVFARVVLKIRGAEIAAPVAIIFTLYSLIEGYSAFILSWAAAHIHSSTDGRMEQVLITLFLDALFFFALQIIKKKYSDSLRQSVTSCLYVLLFPCAAIALGIRYGLELDSRDFARRLSSFDFSARLTAFIAMFAAVVMVFMMIEVFCKMIRLSVYEKNAISLQSQLNGQRVYMEETKKLNDFYSSFQHDIDNHLLVISGLLHERLFPQAQRYTEKLLARCGTPFLRVSTGNPALDVLLKEKLSLAKRSHIAVTHDVAIPKNFQIDDVDLCAVFSNILDNAVSACMEKPPEERMLSVSAKVKSQFLIVEAANATSAVQPVPFGTGLKNIQSIAEKYNGTLETELLNGTFRISVLLCSR